MSQAGKSAGLAGQMLLALEGMGQRRFETIGLSIVGVALLVRIAVALLLGNFDPHTAQIWEYGDIARTSLGHDDLVRIIFMNSHAYAVKTAFMPPLPTYLWEALFAIFGVTRQALIVYMVLNVIGSTLIVWQTRALAAIAGLPRIGILGATAIMTFYPTFVYSAALYHELNIYIPLLLASCMVAYRLAKQPTLRDAAILGILGGLTALVRTEYVVVEAGIYVGAWVAHRRTGLFLVSVLASFLVVIPWTVRNEVVMHKFIPVANSMGYSLWKGFNSETSGSTGDEALVDRWEADQVDPLLAKVKPGPYLENDIDDAYRQVAIRSIAQNPWRLIPLSLSKLVLYWTIDWHDPSITLRPMYLLSVIPVSLLAIWGIFLALRRGVTTFDKIAFGLFLAQSVAIIVYSVQARYRMNVEPLLAIYAGSAIAAMLGMLLRRAPKKSNA